MRKGFASERDLNPCVWLVLSERDREIVIGPDESAPVGMCFMPVMVGNRVHLDLASSAEDRDDEIEHLLALGARRVGIGQADAESWPVLADPRETSSAWYARRRRSPDDNQHQAR